VNWFTKRFRGKPGLLACDADLDRARVIGIELDRSPPKSSPAGENHASFGKNRRNRGGGAPDNRSMAPLYQ
jgi:hypothetical protein